MGAVHLFCADDNDDDDEVSACWAIAEASIYWCGWLARWLLLFDLFSGEITFSAYRVFVFTDAAKVSKGRRRSVEPGSMVGPLPAVPVEDGRTIVGR